MTLSLPRVAVIGSTGTGKSSFANSIGGVKTNDLFKVSAAASSCSYETKAEELRWRGNP